MASANEAPWQVPYGGALTQRDKQRPVQSRDWAVKQSTKHCFVDDGTYPHVEEKPFDWIRGYHVGGRSLM